MSDIPVSPGGEFTAVAEGLDPDLVGTITFGVRELPSGDLAVSATTDAIVEFPQDTDPPTSNYAATRTMPTDAVVGGVGGVTYETAWPDSLVEEQEGITVGWAPAFATVDEVRVYRGLGALTDDQAAQVSLMIETATSLIAEAASKDDLWASTLTPVPRALRSVCLELVARGMSAPGGVALTGETVGTYSYTQEFLAGVMELSEAEVRRVRQTVYGRTSDGSPLEALVNDPEAQIRFPQLGAGSSTLEQLGADDPAAYIGGDGI